MESPSPSSPYFSYFNSFYQYYYQMYSQNQMQFGWIPANNNNNNNNPYNTQQQQFQFPVPPQPQQEQWGRMPMPMMMPPINGSPVPVVHQQQNAWKWTPTEQQRELFQEWKLFCIGYLLTTREGINVRSIAYYLEEHVGDPVPLEKMGLPSINHFLYEMADSIEVRTMDGYKIFVFVREAAIPESMAHVREMVLGQAKDKGCIGQRGEIRRPTKTQSLYASVEILLPNYQRRPSYCNFNYPAPPQQQYPSRPILSPLMYPTSNFNNNHPSRPVPYYGGGGGGWWRRGMMNSGPSNNNYYNYISPSPSPGFQNTQRVSNYAPPPPLPPANTTSTSYNRPPEFGGLNYYAAAGENSLPKITVVSSDPCTSRSVELTNKGSATMTAQTTAGSSAPTQAQATPAILLSSAQSTKLSDAIVLTPTPSTPPAGQPAPGSAQSTPANKATTPSPTSNTTTSSVSSTQPPPPPLKHVSSLVPPSSESLVKKKPTAEEKKDEPCLDTTDDDDDDGGKEPKPNDSTKKEAAAAASAADCSRKQIDAGNSTNEPLNYPGRIKMFYKVPPMDFPELLRGGHQLKANTSLRSFLLGI